MWAKILLLFFVFSFSFRTDHSFDQDLGRHIKLGEIIVQTGQIPKNNLFSYTNPDFPFINTHWLFEVIAYFFASTNTLQLFLLLKIIILILSVWLVIKDIKSPWLLPIGFIFLHVLRERLELRPEIFSFLFTALTYYILTKNNKSIYLLPLIQLLWINTHIYFFIGLLLQAIFLLTHARHGLRRHAGILALSIIVSLLNPNGLSGILYPLNVTQNYGYTIVENQTFVLLESIQFRNPNFLFVKISVVIILISLAFAFFRTGLQIKYALLALAGLILSLMNVRSFPYLVFLSLPAVLQNSGNLNLKFLPIFFGFFLILESFFYLNGSYYKYREDGNTLSLKFIESGKGALDFALKNNLPGPIYNNFDIGSYIIYRAYPKYEVFVDGRPEAYPAKFFTDTYIPTQFDYNKFKELEGQYNFRTIIFPHTDQTPWGRSFLQGVLKDKTWKLIFLDDFMVVLVKEESNLQALDLSSINPNNYKFNNHLSYLRMGFFLLYSGYEDKGKQFIQKSLQVFPQSPITNSLYTGTYKNNFFW
ncbi:MAG: hypothetical protein G01um10147_826 [Microgenomates group bacterium Gr01-1014_7]|nr:MAG: hypothetical protein G01um10147_826 [Microgenomates group bacterium Gr01-1014_7]